MPRKKTHTGKEDAIPLLESIAAGVGVALLAAMAGFLALQAWRTDEKIPPLISVEPVGVVAQPGHYVVEVKVENRSETTGAAVQVEGVLKAGDAAVETSNAAFDYVPGNSEREGALVFTEDPRNYRIDLRVTGYELP